VHIIIILSNEIIQDSGTQVSGMDSQGFGMVQNTLEVEEDLV